MHMETSTRRIRQRLVREGWYLARHGGKHDVYHHPDRIAPIQLPRHRTVSNVVARSIAEAAGWNE